MPARPLALLLTLLSCLPTAHARPEAPIAPKVVIVAMFEVGDDTGDVPGEFQFWVERMDLSRRMPIPAGYRDARLNEDGSVLGLVTGVGNTRAAASIMALGLNEAFDLRSSYWLIAGIAGIDPADGSIGSAVWASQVVDGDLSHEVDAREVPADWPTGYVPLHGSRPYQDPMPTDSVEKGMTYPLNSTLAEWAFQLTRAIDLPDSEALRALRGRFEGYPQAQRPPFVLRGDNLASSTFWHGRKMNAWANEWVRYHTQGQGSYVTTAMEDAGTLHALTALSRAGRVDLQRVLLLRTASNYDMQWSGATAAESLAGEREGGLSGYLPSLEAAYRVGRPVVDALVSGWSNYETNTPVPHE